MNRKKKQKKPANIQTMKKEKYLAVVVYIGHYIIMVVFYCSLVGEY